MFVLLRSGYTSVLNQDRSAVTQHITRHVYRCKQRLIVFYETLMIDFWRITTQCFPLNIGLYIIILA